MSVAIYKIQAKLDWSNYALQGRHRMNQDLPQPDGFLTDIEINASPIDKKKTLLNDDDLKELRLYVGPSNEQKPRDSISSKYDSLQQNKKEWVKNALKK